MVTGRLARMLVQASTDPPLDTEADTIAVGLFEDGEPLARLPQGLTQGLLRSGEAKGELGHLAVLHTGERRVIVVGLGAAQEFDAERARVAAAAAHERALELSCSVLCWEVPVEGGSAAERIVAGVV